MAKYLVGFPIGNSVIGEVVKETENEITLENPLEIMVVPIENRVQVSLIPFKFIFAEAIKPQVTLKKNKLLFIEPLDNFPDLAKGYEEEIQKINAKRQMQQTQQKPQIIT
jgi:predicted P-loop ATPase/GTPase